MESSGVIIWIAFIMLFAAALAGASNYFVRKTGKLRLFVMVTVIYFWVLVPIIGIFLIVCNVDN